MPVTLPAAALAAMSGAPPGAAPMFQPAMSSPRAEVARPSERAMSIAFFMSGSSFVSWKLAVQCGFGVGV
jgi:hypothetical protein